MNYNPLVSIIINCFNGEKYIKETLDSVIAQTYTNWEVILWDNQSSDQTAAIVSSYKDPRIQYFYAPEHTLLGEARRQALMKINGEWVAFLDSDDLWTQDKLDSQIRLLASSADRVSFIYSDFVEKIMPSGDIRKPSEQIKYYSGDVFKALYQNPFVALVSALISVKALKKIGLDWADYNIIEDYILFLELSKIGTVMFVKEPTAIYRRHRESLSYINHGDYKLAYEVLDYFQKRQKLDEKLLGEKIVNQRLLTLKENYINAILNYSAPCSDILFDAWKVNLTITAIFRLLQRKLK